MDISRPQRAPASDAAALSPLGLREPDRAAAGGTIFDDPGFSIGRFKVEAAALVLLISTFAAIQFQEMFTSTTIALRPGHLAQYTPYSYDDKGNGGNSTISMSPRELSWSCDLRPAYQYPFCGYGIMLDRTLRSEGIDLREFQTATIRLRYSGAATKLRINFKNADGRAGAKTDDTVPAEINFPVVQGDQTVQLNLDELAMPVWWALQNKVGLKKPPRDNVTALEVQPGEGAPVGHHEFAVESITFEGQHLSQAQFYLALLAVWVVLLTGLLAYRVLRIRHKFESRHRRQLRESRELQFAKAVAERSSAAKSAFLANMSHELRTPLNAILGYAQLLEQSGLGERDETAVRTIRQSGTHLLTLITDILDLSKIEAGRLELDPAPFELRACITGVGDMMRIRAVEKGLDFGATVEGEVPSRALGDEKRLRQVLINLLGNAMKFTHAGQVDLRVSATPAPAGRLGIRVEVSDTGVGMGEQDLARIFEPFEQAGMAGQRAGGTGLGLSISRQIVSLMGGAIHVESQEGKGSRFWFDLMLEPAEPAVAAASPAAVPSPGGTEAAPAAGDPGFIPTPPREQLEALLALAKAGNMRAIRSFAEQLAEGHPEHAEFAQRLRSLAAGYQSRAILELVSRCAEQKEAA